VVVALLSAAELVTAEQQWHTSRKQQRHKESALLPRPQSIHVSIAGRPLCAAIPGPVVVGSVAVVLRVRLVVLAVVRNKVIEGEPIVHGDEVDRRSGSAPFVRP